MSISSWVLLMLIIVIAAVAIGYHLGYEDGVEDRLFGPLDDYHGPDN